MPTFRVWDTLNNEEEFADEMESDSFEDAAVKYAEGDADGWTDGLYYEEPQPIAVSCDGVTRVFDVQAEFVPHFRARPTPGGAR